MRLRRDFEMRLVGSLSEIALLSSYWTHIGTCDGLTTREIIVAITKACLEFKIHMIRSGLEFTYLR